MIFVSTENKTQNVVSKQQFLILTSSTGKVKKIHCNNIFLSQTQKKVGRREDKKILKKTSENLISLN